MSRLNCRCGDLPGAWFGVSTHYYLHFIEPLRTAASERFANHYGELVSPLPQTARRRR